MNTNKYLYNVQVTYIPTGKSCRYTTFTGSGPLIYRTVKLIEKFDPELNHWREKREFARQVRKRPNDDNWEECEKLRFYHNKYVERRVSLNSEINKNFDPGQTKTFQIKDYIITFTTKEDWRAEKLGEKDEKED